MGNRSGTRLTKEECGHLNGIVGPPVQPWLPPSLIHCPSLLGLHIPSTRVRPSLVVRRGRCALPTCVCLHPSCSEQENSLTKASSFLSFPPCLFRRRVLEHRPAARSRFVVQRRVWRKNPPPFHVFTHAVGSINFCVFLDFSAPFGQALRFHLVCSYPGGNFGQNQLLGSSMSLSPLVPPMASDLHVNRVADIHRGFPRIGRSRE